MSLKPIKLDTAEDRARFVVVAHGRAPNFVRALHAEEKAALAALVDENGVMVENAATGFRDAMVAHNERLKATDAELEGEPVSVQVPEGEPAVVKAAALVAEAAPERDKIVVRGAERAVRFESEPKPGWSKEDEEKYREGTKDT